MQMTGNISSKGQITIPKHYRDEYGIFPHTQVEFRKTDEGLLITKSEDQSVRRQKFEEALKALQKAATLQYTTDEIMEIMRGEDDDKAREIINRVEGSE